MTKDIKNKIRNKLTLKYERNENDKMIIKINIPKFKTVILFSFFGIYILAFALIFYIVIRKKRGSKFLISFFNSDIRIFKNDYLNRDFYKNKILWRQTP